MMKSISVLILMLSSFQVGAQSLQAMNDEDLQDVAAQQGIAFSMEFRINSLADGSAVSASECPDIGVLTGGASCRLALSLADQNGSWIVMKSYRGILKLSNIRIDATNLSGSATAYRDITSYLGGYDPNGKPSIQLTAGAWATANAAGSASLYTFLNKNDSSVYNFTTAMNVDRMTFEFDSGGTPGYMRNSITGAPISLHMADGISTSNYTPSAPMQMRLDGRLQLFGY